jgi:DNA-binding IclR family transcriptional regulator
MYVERTYDERVRSVTEQRQRRPRPDRELARAMGATKAPAISRAAAVLRLLGKSATGRCIAAFGDHSEAELETRFKTLRWDEPPTLDEWKAQVRRTRLQGFTMDAGNYISGVTEIAAPVFRTRAKLSHALVAVGIGNALKRAGLPALQDAIVSAARTLSNQLCGEVSR